MIIPEELTSVIDQISSLPGIGRKSASRIAFYLLRQSVEKNQYLSDSIIKLKNKLEYCEICGGIKGITKECRICENNAREKNLICVVEQPSDIYLIENTGEYHGFYHVLNGVLSPLEGIGPEELRLSELKQRIAQDKQISEVIVAANPSIEGNATAHYIAEMLKEFSTVKVTRIASGLAAGSLLEYADSKTISHSIQSRLAVSV